MEDKQTALEVASLAGHILLENGAEISRVEESMERIANHYGVRNENFFVLSNGIFTTADSGFAKVEFIPFKGAQLERVAAVNQLSRDIEKGLYTTEQAKDRLAHIRNMKSKPKLVQILGSATGSAGFCMIFGGGLLDAASAFVVGALLWCFVVFVSSPFMSKLAGNIAGSLIASILCIVFQRIGFGENLGNMIIGSLIPLIPGIPFTNGIRDIANEDYIAGTTRLLDALLVFFAIAIGVVMAFMGQAWVEGSMVMLHGALTDEVTSMIPVQMAASFVGTIGFAILFGVPSRCYVKTGICAMAGWLVYLLLTRYTIIGATVSTVVSTIVVCLISKSFAVRFKVPVIIFLITGIFPMVPGGGLFWSSYYLASNQFTSALLSGFAAVKTTVAIVIGIVIVSELPQKMFKWMKRRR